MPNIPAQLPGKLHDKLPGKVVVSDGTKHSITVPSSAEEIPLHDEIDSKILIVLTKARDEVNRSESADQDLVREIDKQITRIRRSTAWCTAPKRVRKNWLKTFKQFLYNKTEDGFQDAQLREMHQFLVGLEDYTRQECQRLINRLINTILNG